MSYSWDQELQTLEQDLIQLSRQAARLPDANVLAVIGTLRSKIEQNLGDFVVTHDRIMHLVRRPSKNLGKASTAVLYWARQQMMKTRTLADEFLALQSRKMWLRLLQARFSASSGDEQVTLEARHLVDLVHRRQQLANIEQTLKLDLDAVAQNRKALRSIYEAIGTADENWQASGSMHARLGVNLSDARENPSTLAMRDFMKVVSIPLRHPGEGAKLARLNQDLDRKSEKLVEQCNQLATDFVKKGKDSININSLNQFRNIINQVDDLNREASKQFHRLKLERFSPARPKLVQKSEKQAKTVA